MPYVSRRIALLDIVAIKRGPWRDMATYFPVIYVPNEPRYHI